MVYPIKSITHQYEQWNCIYIGINVNLHSFICGIKILGLYRSFWCINIQLKMDRGKINYVEKYKKHHYIISIVKHDRFQRNMMSS